MMTKTNGGAPMEASSAGRAAELAHERTAHEGAQLHHHHTHAATSNNSTVAMSARPGNTASHQEPVDR